MNVILSEDDKSFIIANGGAQALFRRRILDAFRSNPALPLPDRIDSLIDLITHEMNNTKPEQVKGFVEYLLGQCAYQSGAADRRKR